VPYDIENMPTTQKPQAFYSSNEVSAMAHVSLRQLQWWDEQNLLPVRIEGHRRQYEKHDALMVSVVADLRRKGFSLQRIRKLIRGIGRDLPPAIASADGTVYLIAHLGGDGRRFRLLKNHAEVIDFFSKSYEPLALVTIAAKDWNSI
jgi:DNA-binding transcriptional MerR regulator